MDPPALVPVPVGPCTTGEGLPYAPENFPNPGDKWWWRVGRRTTNAGYHHDRLLYPPASMGREGMVDRRGLASVPAVRRYFEKMFPGADFGAFFRGFLWRVPAKEMDDYTDIEREGSTSASSKQITSSSSKQLQVNGHLEFKPAPKPGECRAGNKVCRPRVQASADPLPAMDCDICCTESGVCRDCCCILCGSTIDLTSGGSSFIRCKARVEKKFICGHVAHIDCALRCYLAGTVRGDIGLDAEYYCRRCDNKTDLIPYLVNLVDTCKSMDSQDDIEKKFDMALCILRGSEKIKAKDLHVHIESMLAKLSSGAKLEDIWNLEDGLLKMSPGHSSGMQNGVSHYESSNIINDTEPLFGKELTEHRAPDPVYITSDYSNASLKLEDDIDRVLEELKKSQESEYRLAEQKLYAQKYLLVSLYQQLERERSHLATPMSGESSSSSLLANVLSRVDQIKREEAKLSQMMQISQGFGTTPRGIIKDYFGLS